MRLETTDASWRIRLGPRARQLVQGVMGEEEKPDGDLLERALSQLDQDLADAKGQIKVLESIEERIAADLAEVKATVQSGWKPLNSTLGISISDGPPRARSPGRGRRCSAPPPR